MSLRFRIKKNFSGGNRFFLDLAAELGEGLTGVFGEPQSGKSALLHCLCGWTSPDRGEISVGARPCFSLSKRRNLPVERRRIGMVFDNDLLFPHMTVRENIAFGGKEGRGLRRYRREVMDTLNVFGLLHRYPASLSGVQRRRAAIARALQPRPDCLLMDEPVSSLGKEDRYRILREVRALNRRFRIPVVYASRSLSEMLAFADEALLLREGRLEGRGGPHQLLLNPSCARQGEEIENIYDLKMTGFNGAEHTVSLEWGEGILKVPCPDFRVRPRRRVCIRAGDVTVSLQGPDSLKTDNIFPAEVKRIFALNGCTVLECDPGGISFLAALTPRSVQELNISPGSRIHLVIGAGAVRFIDEET